MNVTEEAAGIFRIPVHNPFGEPTNAYVLLGQTVILVDVGPSHPRTWADLVQGLAALHLRPEDVREVVLTHGHADHDGLAHRFTWARVLIGQRDLLKVSDYQGHLRRYEDAVRRILPAWGVDGEEARRVPLFFSRLRSSGDAAPWAEPLHDGQELPGTSPPFKVVELPGHTEGLIGLYREEDLVLISSDQLLERIAPNPALYFLSDPPGHGLADYRRSLERILSLSVSKVLPGHGAPFADCAGVAGLYVGQYEARLADALAAVDRPMTVSMLRRRLFPGCDVTNSYHLFVTLVECFARLEVLRVRGSLGRTERKGAFWYERS